ncbi:hypothetical protein HanIR_Chr02g0084021 [Helianthus annuus]|nr:hypothetical protein HanIR_Chr02g0084021 [Helianthus annuus]
MRLKISTTWLNARKACWHYHSLPLRRHLDDLFEPLYFFFFAWISHLMITNIKLDDQKVKDNMTVKHSIISYTSDHLDNNI